MNIFRNGLINKILRLIRFKYNFEAHSVSQSFSYSVDEDLMRHKTETFNLFIYLIFIITKLLQFYSLITIYVVFVLLHCIIGWSYHVLELVKFRSPLDDQVIGFTYSSKCQLQLCGVNHIYIYIWWLNAIMRNK